MLTKERAVFFKAAQGVYIPSQAGFTLLEMLIVILMIGVLASIAAPGWLSFLERTQMTAVANEIHIGIQEAQSKSQRKGQSWQFSLSDQSDTLAWAVHPSSVSPDTAEWNVVESDAIRIDEETSFASSDGIYYVQFDEGGNVRFRLGRVTLTGKRDSRSKRCVIVSTLIGAMRKSKEQAVPRDGKLCY